MQMTLLSSAVNRTSVAATAAIACSDCRSSLRSFAVVGTAVGTWSATVTVYQVYKGSYKRPLATFTGLSNTAPSQYLDLQSNAEYLIAEVTFASNSTADTVTVVVEG